MLKSGSEIIDNGKIYIPTLEPGNEQQTGRYAFPRESLGRSNRLNFNLSVAVRTENQRPTNKWIKTLGFVRVSQNRVLSLPCRSLVACRVNLFVAREYWFETDFSVF